MNIATLWAGMNLIKTGNVLGIKEDKEQEKRIKKNIETYEKEPGILRGFRESGGWVYARVREAHTGQEIWRARNPSGYYPEISFPADKFKTMDEFIAKAHDTENE